MGHKDINANEFPFTQSCIFFTHLSYFGTEVDCGYCRVQPAFHILVVSFQDPMKQTNHIH